MVQIGIKMVEAQTICMSEFKNCDFKLNYIQGYYKNLFSWQDLANLINIRPLMSPKRVKLLDKFNRGYNWYTNGWIKDKTTYPPSLIKNLLKEMVIYFVDMSRVHEKINEFASSMEDEYKRHVDAHIYVCCNPKIEHPFGVHFDHSHNIIIQCEGKTNFKVWEEVEDHSVNIEDRVNLVIDNKPLIDVDMEAGDALWIPRYWPHKATSLTPRLSVSFPFADNENGAHKLSFEDRNWISL